MSSFLTIADAARSQGKVAVSKRVANNTYAERYDGNGTFEEPDAVGIRLHNTTVVKYTKTGELVLNSGGWQTVTTKDRINGFTPSDIKVFSVKGEWRVKYQHGWDGPTVPFTDGITFEINTLAGVGWTPVEGTYPSESQEFLLREAKRKLDRDIKVYVAKLTTVLPIWATELKLNGGFKTGSGCLYCQVDGDAATGTDHLWSHLQEGYVFPSLVLNAYRDKGYGKPEFVMALDVTGDHTQVGKMVTRYLRKRLSPTTRPSAEAVSAAGLEQQVKFAELALGRPEDFGYFGGDDNLWKSSAPTWTKTRDSDYIERANFQVVWDGLKDEFSDLFPASLDAEGYPDRDFSDWPAIYVFGASHWAVGHIDQIVVPVKLDRDKPLGPDNLHPSFLRVLAYREAQEMYPALDGAEEIAAEMESTEITEDVDGTLQALDEPELTAARDQIVDYAVRQGGEWGYSYEAVRQAFADVTAQV